MFSNPFNPNARLACQCGRHASAAEHDSVYGTALKALIHEE